MRGKLVTRGRAKRADYILYFKPNIPLALIEAKDNSHSVGDGIQQGLDYAATLDIPFKQLARKIGADAGKDEDEVMQRLAKQRRQLAKRD